MGRANGQSSSAISLLRSWYSTWVPSMGYRDFRNLWLSTAGSSVGAWIEQVALGWLVLELTNSPFMVGVAAGVRMAPFFLFGIVAGAVADRVNRLIFMRLLAGVLVVLALAMAILIYLEILQIWHALVIAFAMGSIRALYMPLRQSFAYDVVGGANTLNSLALLSLSMRMGGLAGGPMGGAVIASWGLGAAYVAIAASHAASIVALLVIRETGQAAPVTREPMLQNLQGAIRMMRSNQVLAGLTVMTATAEVLGYSYATVLPVLARDVLRVGAGGLGILTGLQSLGGIVGVVALMAVSRSARSGKLLLFCLGLFGVGLVALGYSRLFPAVLAVMLLVGAVAAATDVLIPTLMQLAVPNEQRGRAMGARVFGIGVGPVGQLEIGAMAGLLGAQAALAINGGALLLMTALSALAVPRLRRL